jgi:PIN domain nuclease of toxin-antitoxin system
VKGYLLDTHVLLWWLSNPAQLSEAARQAIANPAHTIYVSAAAAWEIAIKQALGRLEIPSDLPEALERGGLRSLTITLEHGLTVAKLPDHHQDPFDRMMIAQAQLESLVLITHDTRMHQYDVATLSA